MEAPNASALDTARAHAVEAGRILSLLKLPVISGHRFTPMISIYGDFMDPTTTDARQFAACLSVATVVEATLIAEAAANQPAERGTRFQDPYRREYRGDLRSALLEICAKHLTDARVGFEAAGVAPVEPYLLSIGQVG